MNSSFIDTCHDLAEFDALVLTGDQPPIPGHPANGAGLRAWGIARGLRELGVKAALIFPDRADRTYRRESLEEWEFCLERSQVIVLPQVLRVLGEAGDAHSMPRIIFQHWAMASECDLTGIQYAVDLAGPHLLERRYWGKFSIRESIEVKSPVLRGASFLQAGGETQRHYFQLFRDDLEIPVSNFVLPDWSKSKEGDSTDNGISTSLENLSRPIILFCGLALPWQDPSWALETTVEWIDQNQKGTLLLVSPMLASLGSEERERFDELANRLDNHSAVRRLGLLSFDQVIEITRRSDIALDLFAPNSERRLAVPSRTAVYAACGLPVVFNNYSDWSPLFDEGKLKGKTVEWENKDQLFSALSSLAENSEANAVEGQCEVFDSAVNLSPLADWTRGNNPNKLIDNGSVVLDWSEVLNQAGERLRAIESQLEKSQADVIHAALDELRQAAEAEENGKTKLSEAGDSHETKVRVPRAFRRLVGTCAALVAVPVARWMAGRLSNMRKHDVTDVSTGEVAD
jgi:hypothetical protein